jgi:tRNA nucleotidyltransferase (CCA-adding enzyme)
MARSGKAKSDKVLRAGVTRELRRIGGLARKRGMSAFIVGGMVRDLILRRPSIEGNAVKVARDYAKAVGGRVKGVTRFGTCKVEGGPAGAVDFASTRTETYRRPGALPDVEVFPHIIVDLERRDFAVNAMAIQLSASTHGVLLDPFDGWGDVERGHLTVLHPESFTDDPTRVLRGVRFAARYGYRFEKHTRGWLEACVSGGSMKTVSGKRIRRELELIFAEEDAIGGMRLLDTYGVLEGIDRDLALGPAKRQRLAAAGRALSRFTGLTGGAEFDPRVYWFGYLFMGVEPGAITRLIRYFNLDKRFGATCRYMYPGLFDDWMALRLMDPPYAFEATGLLRALPPESLALLYFASDRRERGIIESYVKRWRHVKPLLTGADLIELGMKPGPAVGEMLDEILEAKLLGGLGTRRSELAFVARQLKAI